MDLNRSVRLLEDALSPQGRSLLRTGTPKRTKTQQKSVTILTTTTPIRIEKNETRQLLEGVNRELESVLDYTNVTGSVLQSNKPWETASDSLFIECLEVIQARTNIDEIFETVSDLARCCTDTLNVIKGLKSKVQNVPVRNERWLENERNTWRLIYCLYQDRLKYAEESPTDNEMPYLGVSEKLCVENLYKRNALVRESQLITDWLECNANEQDNDEPRIEYYTDKTIGWENTLHQLQASDSIVFRSTRPIVTRLDPDATTRQILPLHDLDVEDEERLCRKIFKGVRSGRLDDVQTLCIYCGHPWRAALLEGWRLHHDPNLPYKNENENENHSENELTLKKIYDKQNPNTEAVQSIEGNVNRDMWKQFAWKYCQQESINVYDRATIASLCGCLSRVLSVCTTWEDHLWAYLKVMIDIRVESEIRDFVPKQYQPLPSDYWNNKMSLDEIFEKITGSTDSEIRDEANSPHRLIQKYIILDQIPQLMRAMQEWISIRSTDSQFLRFLAHLVLFFKHIGRSQLDDIGEQVLEAYVKCLMDRNDPQLVAYYVSTLSQNRQVKLYASFLEHIVANEERKRALEFGEDAGLDVHVIAKQVVENIRFRPDDFDDASGLQKTVSDKDKDKISALDWLLFDPIQRSELIIQCNTLIAQFLILGRLEAAKQSFNKIPPDAIDTLLSLPDEEISAQLQRSIREHLCYKTYLDAHDAFNDWFKYWHHARPQPPATLALSDATFAEKVAYQHKQSQYKAEMERWRLTSSHLTRTARIKLFNVLLFPDGGWLCGTDGPEQVRGICIPETVLLLYAVLSETGQHTECVQLTDVLASKKYKLYKVYNKEKLEDILKKLFETTIALLNENKSMWGDYKS